MKSDYKQRDSARRLLQSALAKAFPEDESLRSFLNELGRRSVVRAVLPSRTACKAALISFIEVAARSYISR